MNISVLIYSVALVTRARLSLHANLARLLTGRSASRPLYKPWTTRKVDRPRCGAKTRKGHPCRAPAERDER